MRHPHLRQLFGHWDALRAGRPAPDRTMLSLPDLAPMVGDLLLLGEAEAGWPLRLAGSRACELLGFELTGRLFPSLWDSEGGGEVANMLLGVADEARPVVAGATLVGADRPHAPRRQAAGAAMLTAPTAGRTPDDVAHVELLLLPLRHRGRHDERMLAAMAVTLAAKSPSPNPVRRALCLSSYRFLDRPIRAGRTAVGLGPHRPAEPRRINDAIGQRAQFMLLQERLSES